MRRALLVPLLSLAATSSSCQLPSPAPPPADAAELVAVLEAQQRAWNEGSVEDYMAAGYLRSEELTFLSGGDWTRGYDVVLARYRKRYVEGDREMGRLTFSGLEPELLATDVGIVRGRWAVNFPDGTSLSGLFTLVMRYTSEGWRIVHDHTSSAESAG